MKTRPYREKQPSLACGSRHKNIANGRWLIDVDGTCDVYDIARLPG
ncbi:hypothetical protein Q8W43_20425 [Klebsiella pneumoniae]|nr:hypothetical protein Q8W43_20425 [Klebsiella pneumoniae]